MCLINYVLVLLQGGSSYVKQSNLYNATNSMGITGVRVDDFPIYTLLLIADNVNACLYLAYGTVEVLTKLNSEQTVLGKKGKRIFWGVF